MSRLRPAVPRWLSTAAILLILLASSLAFQGARGLWEPDEGRYVDVAIEMVALHDEVTPHLSHEQAHWTKPPLTYWAIASSFQVLGRTEFAARLAGALAFFAAAVLLGLLGRLFVPATRWAGGLVYATSVLPFVASSVVTTDTLLAFWECLGVYAYARATWHPGCRRPTAWLMLMWVAFGLAFLTKGPPGLLPLLAIVGCNLTTPELRRGRGLRTWPGILVMLLVALPWYLLVIYRNPALLSYFIEREVVARVASADFSRNAEWYGAFRVYVPALLLGLLPWTGWLLRAGWRFLKFWQQRGREAWRSLDSKKRFLLWWLLLPLTVLFIARSRLPLYVLPLAAPLALIATRELQRSRLWNTRAGVVLLAVWMCALPLARLGSAMIDTRKDARATAQLLRDAGITSCGEIAFYDTRPMLGLRFYMDCEIERVRHGELKDELAEPEPRLWAVHRDVALGFEQRMLDNGRRVEQIADVPRRWLVYREYPPDP